jgi:hypothetical protein
MVRDAGAAGERLPPQVRLRVADRGLVENDPWVAPIFKDKLELRSHLNEHKIVLSREAARLCGD